MTTDQPQATREDAERWIDIAERLPEYVSRDDAPCVVHGKEIPPTLSSKTVLVALTGGGVRTRRWPTPTPGADAPGNGAADGKAAGHLF